MKTSDNLVAWTIACLTAFALPDAVGAQESAMGTRGLEDRLRSEYPAAVQRLLAPMKNIHCKSHGDVTRYRFEADYFVKGSSRLAILKLDPGHKPADWGISTVNCWTEKYAFELEQSVAGGPFLVRSLAKDATALKKAAWGITLDLELYVFASVNIFEASFATMLEDDKFKITRISQDYTNGEELVELEFDRAGATYVPPYDSGRVVLSPTLDWAIREYELAPKALVPGYQSSRKGTVEYQRWAPGGFVFPKRIDNVDHTMQPDGKENHRERHIEFKTVTLNEVSDSQFTLAAFGLPDLSVVRRSYYPFDSWVFWTFAWLAVGSGGILWYKYRRKT